MTSAKKHCAWLEFPPGTRVRIAGAYPVDTRGSVVGYRNGLFRVALDKPPITESYRWWELRRIPPLQQLAEAAE